MQLNKADTFYLYSDGYADQFGGANLRKMKVGKFREFVISIQDQPMDKQQALLEKFLDDWKGDYQQIDDILVIGRKFA